MDSALYSLLAPSQNEESYQLAALCESVHAHGLTMTPEEARQLMAIQRQALLDTGRVEIGCTVLRKLAASFAASPYAHPEDFASLLGNLTGWFYHFKNAAPHPLSDDELIDWMRYAFDHRCMGQPDLLEREWERRLGRAGDNYAALPDWFDT